MSSSDPIESIDRATRPRGASDASAGYMGRQHILHQRLVELVDEILAGHGMQPIDLRDAADATCETWDADICAELSDEELVLVSHVLAALRRVSPGAYDGCVTCGSRIGLTHLLVDPTTKNCDDCERDIQWRPAR